jgi:hypothetical protein
LYEERELAEGILRYLWVCLLKKLLLHGEDDSRRIVKSLCVTDLLIFNVKPRLGYVKAGLANE